MSSIRRQLAQALPGVSERSLDVLAQAATISSAGAGEVIVRKGDPVDGVYLVQRGALRVFTLDGREFTKPIYQLEAGEMCLLSMHCSLHAQRYPAWVSVESRRVSVIAIPAAAFRQVFQADAAVSAFVLRNLADQLFDLMTAIEASAQMGMGDRINGYLVRACPADAVVRVGHQQIADSLGTAREVVSRHLRNLERRGLVQLGRMRIQILDITALTQMSEGGAM